MLLTAAATVGLAASIGLHVLGLRPLWLRYPAAGALAYGVFVFGLHVWVARLETRWRGRPTRRWRDALADLVAPSDAPSFGDDPAATASCEFGGGSFGGGGAGGSFADVTDAGPIASEASADAGSHVAGRALEAIDVDDAWPLVIAAAIVAAVLLTSLYAIWIAPTLIGELVLDAVIAGAVYRRTRRIDPVSVLRRTWVAAACMVASLALIGAAAGRVRPDAQTIGDLFRSPARAAAAW